MRDRKLDILVKPFRVAYYTTLRILRWVAARAAGLVRRRLASPPSFDEIAWSKPILVAFYVGGNLNLIDGSSVWTQTTAEVLHTDPRLGIVMPLRFADKRSVITGALRQLDRVALIDTSWYRTLGSLRIEEAIDLIRWLDERRRFDVVMLRGYAYCLHAVQTGVFGDRLWSAYVLEPERDREDLEHLAGLEKIALGSRFIFAQTEGFRALIEEIVPAARGKVLLLPPAVPSVEDTPMPPRAHRLFYTGKFAPQYPFLELVEIFTELRREFPALEFHVAGDKIHRARARSGFARSVERALAETDGLTWHGGVPRSEVLALLARGGIALNVWDPAYASTLNDLVVPSKTLDYCAAGVPVVAHDTSTHRELLGETYPFLAAGPASVAELVRILLTDQRAYEAAASRCRAAVRAYSYEAIGARLRPAFDEVIAEGRATTGG